MQIFAWFLRFRQEYNLFHKLARTTYSAFFWHSYHLVRKFLHSFARGVPRINNVTFVFALKIGNMFYVQINNSNVRMQ